MLRRTLEQRGDLAAEAYLRGIGTTILEKLGRGRYVITDDEDLAHVSVVIGHDKADVDRYACRLPSETRRLRDLCRYRNETYRPGRLRLDILRIIPTGEHQALVEHTKTSF